MPVHDWTRVESGTFHAFHTAWVTHLSETLNGGVLPPGYYALPEQHAGRLIADVLTLQAPSPESPLPRQGDGGVAVADAPPTVRRSAALPRTERAARRTLAIRHISNHRIVALVEILSPSNKDRAASVEEFVDKAESAIYHGINLLLVDLLPPGSHDPQGVRAVLCARFEDDSFALPSDEPLTLAAWVAGLEPVTHVEYLAVGSPLPEMPLFLNPDRYVKAPLEQTYQAAFRGLPAFWRDVLEKRS